MCGVSILLLPLCPPVAFRPHPPLPSFLSCFSFLFRYVLSLAPTRLILPLSGRLPVLLLPAGAVLATFLRDSVIFSSIDASCARGRHRHLLLGLPHPDPLIDLVSLLDPCATDVLSTLAFRAHMIPQRDDKDHVPK